MCHAILLQKIAIKLNSMRRIYRLWWMFFLTITAVVYVASVIFLTLFISNFGALLVVYGLTRHKRPELPRIEDDDLFSVTIQLPIYNEAHVIDRLLDACAQIDYPRDKFNIQILDDSTDETTQVVQQKIDDWKAKGIDNITLVRRPDRQGYKAGALAYGLTLTDTDCVAIFDADFIPPVDFLRKTMPTFPIIISLLSSKPVGHIST